MSVYPYMYRFTENFGTWRLKIRFTAVIRLQAASLPESCQRETYNRHMMRQHITNKLTATVRQQNAPLKSHLHEALALQFVHPVGGAVQPLSLWVQHRVSHLPPCPTVQQQSQTHHTADGDQHCVHRPVLPFHLKDGQQRHAGDQTGQYQDKYDEGRHAARLLPLPLTWDNEWWEEPELKNCFIQGILCVCLCVHMHVCLWDSLCVSSVLNTLNRRVARKPNSLSQASESVAIISAIDVSPPTLDRRL